MMNLNEISLSVQQGKGRETSDLIARALEEKYTVERILQKGLMAGIRAAEQEYGKQNPCAPELLAAVRAMNMGVKALRAGLDPITEESHGTVIVGTVQEELYDIEKNLTTLMMQIMGLRVVDLGVSVSPEEFVTAAKEENAQLIACSAELLSTMHHMKGIVQAAEAVGIRNRIKIMISGKPVTDQYRALIGADYYVTGPNNAAEICAALFRLKPAA